MYSPSRHVAFLPPKAPYPLPRRGQLQLFVRAYAPFSTFGRRWTTNPDDPYMAYGGDRRTGPSTDTRASARVTYVAPIVLETMKLDASARRAFCDPSEATQAVGVAFGRLMGGHYDSETRSVTKTAKAIGSEAIENIGRPGTGLAGYVALAGANPLVPFSPDIDVRLNIKVLKEGDRLRFVGNLAGDRFPNAEAFIRDTNGRTFLLADYRTDGDRDSGPLSRLPGQSFFIEAGFDVWLDLRPDGTLG